MYCINLFLNFNEGHGVTIGMEQIIFTDEYPSSNWMFYGNCTPTVLELIQNEVSSERVEQITGELNRQIGNSPGHLLLKHEGGNERVRQLITCYTVPSTLAFQFHLLHAIGRYVNARPYDGIFVSSGPLLDAKKLPDFNSLRKKIDAQVKRSPDTFEYFEVLVKMINDSPLSETEKNACSFVRYYRFSKSLGIPFNECLLAKNRFVINHMDKLPGKIKHLSIPLKVILKHAISILPANEYEQLIKELAQDAKKALFLPCIGQKADDGKYYNFRYTEYNLIENMALTLVDGQLVVDLTSNKGYQDHYAPGKSNHEILKREMLFLAQYNGWELEDTDFQVRMAFTPECTQKLLQTGIINPGFMPDNTDSISDSKASFFYSSSSSESEDEEIEECLIL